MFWKIIRRGKLISSPHNCIIFTDISSWPCALLLLSNLIRSFISVSVIAKVDRRSGVWCRMRGKTLGVSKGVHCWAKYSLNILAFSLQETMKFPLWKRGGILGILVLFKKIIHDLPVSLLAGRLISKFEALCFQIVFLGRFNKSSRCWFKIIKDGLVGS